MIGLYELGEVSWWESQCYYHALAELGREGLIICYPSTPYICLGLHDDLEQELDWAYCRQRGLPLLRRETGGGVVYLDRRQVFFQLVLRQDNPMLPLRRDRFYARFLKPAVAVYRELGIPAEIRAPADIVVAGRKCSGNAAGDIGSGAAYVGNLLLDFDFDIMCRALRVPNPVFGYYLRQAMRKSMATVSDYLAHPVSYPYLAGRLAAHFAAEFGEMARDAVDEEMRQTGLALRERLTAMEWLRLPGRRQRLRRVKIAEGVYLQENMSTEHGLPLLLREGREETLEEEFACHHG